MENTTAFTSVLACYLLAPYDWFSIKVGLPFLFIIIIAGFLLSSDRMGQNIFLNPRQSC
jgi:hypothetical protein